MSSLARRGEAGRGGAGEQAVVNHVCLFSLSPYLLVVLEVLSQAAVFNARGICRDRLKSSCAKYRKYFKDEASSSFCGQKCNQKGLTGLVRKCCDEWGFVFFLSSCKSFQHKCESPKPNVF